MGNKQIIFKETQNAYWVFILGIISIVPIVIVSKMQLEKIEILSNILIIVSIIIISITLLFYKLTIIICNEKFTISFGIIVGLYYLVEIYDQGKLMNDE